MGSEKWSNYVQKIINSILIPKQNDNLAFIIHNSNISEVSRHLIFIFQFRLANNSMWVIHHSYEIDTKLSINNTQL